MKMCLFLNAMVAIFDLPLNPSIILPLLKCSEISKAQDRLTDLLQSIYVSHPQYRELLRMILSTVGRGGEGDVGQRIRDEILVIQVEIFIDYIVHSLCGLIFDSPHFWAMFRVA